MKPSEFATDILGIKLNKYQKQLLDAPTTRLLTADELSERDKAQMRLLRQEWEEFKRACKL